MRTSLKGWLQVLANLKITGSLVRYYEAVLARACVCACVGGRAGGRVWVGWVGRRTGGCLELVYTVRVKVYTSVRMDNLV